uniref:Uncharacterized protein n=1 Tax=Arundo donax TaxID=35708 RepID=A0A0A9E8N2_ARUDO
MYVINQEAYDKLTRSLIGQGKHLQQPSLHNTHIPTTGTQTYGTSRSIPDIVHKVPPISPRHKNSFTHAFPTPAHTSSSRKQPLQSYKYKRQVMVI